MRMSLKCHECFVRQALLEIEMSGLATGDIEKAMRNVLRLLSGADYDCTPTRIAYLIHREVEALAGSSDPYLNLKRKSTERMLDMEGELRRRIREAVNPLYEAALIAVVGNVIDYGAKNLFDLGETLDRAREHGFAIDHFEEFERSLEGAEEMIYILDNSGEVVLDRLFMEGVLERCPGLRIRAVVKRDPILNDVTREDALHAGLGAVKGVDIVEQAGPGWLLPEELKGMEHADIMISKGQGNFEGLNEYPGLFLLLIVKCEVVAEFAGVKVGDMIFMYNGAGGGWNG